MSPCAQIAAAIVTVTAAAAAAAASAAANAVVTAATFATASAASTVALSCFNTPIITVIGCGCCCCLDSVEIQHRRCYSVIGCYQRRVGIVSRAVH